MKPKLKVIFTVFELEHSGYTYRLTLTDKAYAGCVTVKRAPTPPAPTDPTAKPRGIRWTDLSLIEEPTPASFTAFNWMPTYQVTSLFSFNSVNEAIDAITRHKQCI